MSMSKFVIMHHLPDNNQRPALERWFWQHHCPEVLAQAPWTTRYVLYRAVPAPPGAEGFGYFNYRVHENWVRSAEERRGVRGLLSMTPQPGYMDVVVVNVPAEPTEDFLGADLRPDDKTILRWLIAFRYPEGIAEEEAEDWYLNVHAPEVCRQPGLIRYFSHKALLPMHGSPIPASKAQRPFITQPSPFLAKRWHRVSEQWYENDDGWVESILRSPPAYTRPPWATHDRYPFVKPGSEFVSTFVLERPDEDMLRHGVQQVF